MIALDIPHRHLPQQTDVGIFKARIVTGSPRDRDEYIERHACAGIQHAVAQLAAIKNIAISADHCAQIAGDIASAIGPDGRRRFVEGPSRELKRDLIWSINNSLDWGAAHDFVFTYMLVHKLQLPSQAVGHLVWKVLDALKGENQVGGPTWRWPEPAHASRVMVERGAGAPLDLLALGARVVDDIKELAYAPA